MTTKVVTVKYVEAIPMLLWCPLCHARHVDVHAFSTRPHKVHACQNCGHLWQPALVPTCGVAFLPGCKNT
jgi:rubredoxin